MASVQILSSLPLALSFSLVMFISFHLPLATFPFILVHSNFNAFDSISLSLFGWKMCAIRPSRRVTFCLFGAFSLAISFFLLMPHFLSQPNLHTIQRRRGVCLKSQYRLAEPVDHRSQCSLFVPFLFGLDIWRGIKSDRCRAGRTESRSGSIRTGPNLPEHAE